MPAEEDSTISRSKCFFFSEFHNEKVRESRILGRYEGRYLEC